MNHKKLIYSGVFVSVTSIIISMLITIWGFYDAFNALRTNQTAGVGAVGGSIGTSVIAVFFGAVGLSIGLSLIIIGAVKSREKSKLEN